jgi:hypothetical protein
MPKGRQGEFAKAGKGGFEEGSNAPRASGGKGSQLSAIAGVFEDFWGRDQRNGAEECLAEECRIT